jgi:hypothetical protein
MRTLSIRQPWIDAILRFGKRLENRDWAAVPAYRGPILLHASARRETRRDFQQARLTLLELGFDCPRIDELPMGAIVGRCNLVDVYNQRNTAGHRYPMVGSGSTCIGCGYRRLTTEEILHGGATSGPIVCPKRDPWTVPGTLGLVLENVQKLEKPLQWKGALGLFEVPDDILVGAKFVDCVAP